MPDTQSPQDMSSAVESTPVYAPHAGATAMPMMAWAMVKGGVVEDIKVVANYLPHPFPEHEADGGRVINVTSVPCSVGFVVDTHGNVAPPPAMTADGIEMAPSMPAAGAQAAMVQADPVEDKVISTDDMNKRREELVAASKPDDAKPTPPVASPTPVTAPAKA